MTDKSFISWLRSLGGKDRSGLITVGEPPGMLWDSEDQRLEYENMISALRPGLSAYLQRGHGGGSQTGYMSRPRSRFSVDDESLALNALYSRPLTDLIREARAVHGKVPDLCFSGLCNSMGADIPNMFKDVVGKVPNRLIYTPAGYYSNPSVSRPALEYALKRDRPWFFPSRKDFDNPTNEALRTRVDMRPLVPVSASLPALAGVLGASGVLFAGRNRRDKKKKPPGYGKAVGAGLGAAGLTWLGLKAHDLVTRDIVRQQRGTYDYEDPRQGLLLPFFRNATPPAQVRGMK